MLRVAFMGTPDFSVPALTEIIGQGHEVVACYTQPPRPAGRGMAERLSPVHEAAERYGLVVRHPEKLSDPDIQAEFAALDADVAVVVAYGLLLPEQVLAAPEYGCLNIHASLLPRWRGAAPINRAVMAGDEETGVAIMQMEKGLDTGPVAMMERTAIDPTETAGELHDRLARLGADLIVRALGAMERGSLDFEPQTDDGVLYAAKIDKAEAKIDFDKPADAVRRHIHGLSPFPGAWCEMPNGSGKQERLKILRAQWDEDLHESQPGSLLDDQLTIACKSGVLKPTLLQRAGKAAMDRETFLRGVRLEAGGHLG